jgi:uncharacterized protein (DUF362 family)
MKSDRESRQQITRREFCKRSALLAAGTIGCAYGLKGKYSHSATPGVAGNRVVWVHDSNATYWNGSSGYYGDYVDQPTVNAMIENGIIELTGRSSAVLAWRRIIPNYSQGKKIGIKININNGGNDNHIDALPAPVNAVIAGLKSIGVAESDIYILEPSRGIPTRIADPILSRYPNVVLWGYSEVTYSSPDPSLIIIHSHPTLSDSKLPDQLRELTYLINMPIIKGHGGAGITLTFKNNFGFFQDANIGKFHPYTFLSGSQFTYDRNPLVDIYLNQHIRDKTVLIIGDALFGHRISNAGIPEVWNTFGGEFPNSIFLSTDPVAIDSVMFDFLNAEYPKPAESQLHLERAAEMGLGTHDHWNNPSDKRYSRIDFRTLDEGTAINIITPNGGEILPSGSFHTIHWETPFEADSFQIDYSTRNGRRWKLIDNGIQDTSYDWEVPIPRRRNERSCRVRVTGYDASGKMVSEGTSDSAFTIAVVTVTSPSGGETLVSGDSHSITWATNATIRPVERVQLRFSKKGGRGWKRIADLTGNPGSYDWTPDVPKTETRCRVRVILKDARGKKVGYGDSEDDFTIEVTP